MTISRFNCQGISNEERVVEFENVLVLDNLGIVRLCEIKRDGEKLIVRPNGNMFYNFRSSACYRMVGFYVD